MDQTHIVSKEFTHSLWKMIRRQARSDSDSDDILQDVLLKLLKNAEKLESTNLLAWLRRVVQTTSIDFYRKQKNYDEISENLADLPEESEQDLYAGLAKCVRPLIERLSSEERTILSKIELERGSQKVLAQELGLEYPTLKSKVQRARQKLKSEILECCSVELDARNKPLEAKEKKDNCC